MYSNGMCLLLHSNQLQLNSNEYIGPESINGTTFRSGAILSRSFSHFCVWCRSWCSHNVLDNGFIVKR
ncbi:hypothetical protein BLOT_008473 [Blomia tropicalis]|nr:hypothetical protein BLOT_008473 [Blomia tropicalis]